MRLKAWVGEREWAVEVTAATGGCRVSSAADGPVAEVRGRGPVHTVLLGNRTIEAAVVGTGAAWDAGRPGRGWDVTIGGRLYTVRLVDALRAASGLAAEAEQARHSGEVRAVMPGKVVAVLVAEGQDVQAGQGLLVVEAMKMENEITAPRAGRVSAIRARPGGPVEAGALLLSLE